MRVKKQVSNWARAAANVAVIPVPTHTTGDLLCVFIAVDSSTISSATDLSIEDSITGDEDLYCYTYTGDGSLTTTNIGTTNATTYVTYHWYVIEGAPTGSMGSFLTASKVDSGTVTAPTFPALTVSGTNRSLILFCAAGGGISPVLPPIGYFNGGLETPVSNISSTSFYTYQDASANISAIATINGGVADIYTYLVVEITSSDNVLESYCTNTPATAIYAAGTNAISEGQADVNLAATIGTIDGLTLVDSGTDANFSSTYTPAALFDSYYSGGFYCNNSADATTYDGDLQIIAIPFPADKDLSGKTLSVGFFYSGTSVLGTYDEWCSFFGLYDDTATAAIAWKLKGWDTSPKVNTKTVNIIDIDGGYEDATTGTWTASTAVSHVLFGGVIKDGVYNNKYLFYPVYSLDAPITVAGGNTTRPTSFETMYRISDVGGLNTVQKQQGQASGQYYFTQSWSMGDGTNAIVWDSTGQSIEMPSAMDVANGRTQSKIPTASLTGTMDGDGKVIANTWNFGDYHKCIIKSGTGTGRATVLNATPVFTGGTVTGWTFSGCKGYSGTIGTTLTGGNSFVDGADTTQFTVSSEAEFFKLIECNFSGFTSAITITGDQTGTWGSVTAFAAGTFSGNTQDIDYQGTTPFTIVVDTTLTVLNSGGSTLTISAPVVNTGLNFTGLVTGSQVVIYNNGLTTEIQRNNSTTGTELWSETYSADQDVDYTILKAGYDPIRVAGVTAGNTVQTIPVAQKLARSYNSGVTFTYGTDGAYAATVFTLTKLMTVQDYYSAMIDAWIANETNTALKNVTFPINPNGVNSYSFDDATFDEADLLQYLYRDGIRYTSSGTVTKKYAAVLSQGDVGTDVAEIQQVEGNAPQEYTRAGSSVKSWNVPLQTEGGVVDCLIPVYDSTPVTGFDYTGYMVIEYAKAGKYQDRVLAHDVYGTLEDELYVVAVASTSSPITGADPALANPPTITRHAPVTWNGKDFSMTITDSAAGNTAANIAQWFNWNVREENDSAFEGDDPMNYYDAVQDDGTGLWRTRYGLHIGFGFTGCRVVLNDGTTAHSGFSRMESDTEGDYYTLPQSASATINNITTTSRVQLYDTANSVELYNGVPGATSYAYSETYSVDRTVRVRITDVVGATAKEMIEAVVGSISTSNYDVSYNAAQVDDDTYNNNALDGSAVTGITIDDTNDLVNINIAGGSVSWAQIYAYQVYWLNTATGIQDDFAFIEAPDTANYILTSFLIKNTSTGPVVPLVITGGYGRDSVTGASVDLWDQTGGSIFPSPDHVVAYATGSGPLTAGQQVQLTNAATAAANATILATIDGKVDTVQTRLDLDATKPNTYADNGSTIVNSDFTLTKTDNGNGTFTVAKT